MVNRVPSSADTTQAATPRFLGAHLDDAHERDG